MMDTMNELDVQECDVMAGMLQLASALLYKEPDRETLDALAERDVFAEVPLGGANASLQQGFALLHDALLGYAALAGSGRDQMVRELGREWLRLFGGVGEPQVPSWANYYLDSESRVLGRETLDVRHAYAAFGMRMRDLNREPDDGLAIMLGFLAHLCALEGRALADEDAAEAERLRDAQRDFLRAHVLPWMARWHYLGERHATSAFYRGVVEYVFGIVCQVAGRLGFVWHADRQAFSIRLGAAA